MRKTLAFASVAVALFAVALAKAQSPQEMPTQRIPLKDVITHDPVMAKEGDTYYLFATGMGISRLSSNDLEVWSTEQPVFSPCPAWITTVLPDFKGNVWAPDVIFHKGLWHVFYSCSSFGTNNSLIAHATSPSLNPKSSACKWKDEGFILQSKPHQNPWNAIDPNIVIDDEGTPWMTFGSFWDGIQMVRLTPDLKQVAEPAEWHALVKRTDPADNAYGNERNTAVEAPFIMKHGAYYYLFVSFDFCCRGLNSNYKVAVGRSKTVTGPYVDKEGRRMDQGGGSILIQGNENWAGVGHNAAYHFGDADYFIAHAYNKAQNGAPKLIIRRINWTKDHWPVVGW